MKTLYLLASILLLLFSLIVLQSCVPAAPPPVEEEDLQYLTLHLDPEYLVINAGGRGEVVVTIERIGFDGGVTLSILNPPTWLNPSFDPSTVPTGSNTSTLTITLDPAAISGQYTEEVRGDNTSISSTGATILSISVMPAQQDFSLLLSKDSISIEQGDTDSVMVNIERVQNFSEPITLSLEGTPTGVTPVFDPNPATGSSSRLTLSADASVTPANYNLTIQGTANTSEETVPITLTVTGAPDTVVWEIKTAGVLANLYGLHFINDNLGWVVGDYGAIYKVENSGNSIALQDSKSDQIFNDVHFTDASTGVAVGTAGTIRRTTNGGVTWDSLSSPSVWNLNGVFFINENRGWVVSHYGIHRTTDAGENWETQYQTNGFFDSYRSVYFTSADIGTVIGNDQNIGGAILRTTNGGTTWDMQTSGITQNLQDVYFSDVNTGTIVGWYGTILRTTNGGISWDTQTSGTSGHLKGVAFTDVDNGWTVGGGEEGGLIFHTTNGGTAWEKHVYSQFYILNEIFFVDSNMGYVVGYDGVILRKSE
jgi:photosystem II stability/assembly factor-like uncharacterized protein